MFIPISRILAIAMAGVLCLGLLVPMSLARHNAPLAIFIVVLYLGYVVANLLLWQRMRPRA
ncbi:MAG: hypothetical protein WA814_12300 [Candidatus Baltobacteraceae bacterium]